MPQNNTTYRVHISQFDGPLDLLWHLIKDTKIDILDIPISEITHDYLAYMEEIADLPLSDAIEFYYTAAQLISIKSRVLSGHPTSEPLEDPREELVTQLIEYQRIKKLSSMMASRIIHDNRSISRMSHSSARQVHLNPIDDPHQKKLSKTYSRELLATTIMQLTQAQLIEQLFPAIRPTNIQAIMAHIVKCIAHEGTHLRTLVNQLNHGVPVEKLINTLHAVLFAASQKLVIIDQERPFSIIYISRGPAYAR